jgi:hypothetical protein
MINYETSDNILSSDSKLNVNKKLQNGITEKK